MSDDAVPPPPPSSPPPPPPPGTPASAPPPAAPPPVPPVPPAPPATTTSSPGAPIVVECDYPEHVANWRPLVHWLLVIPQLVVAMVLVYASMVVAFISFFTVLFTRQVPEGMHNFMVMTVRYHWRVNSYAYFMRESYPPFDFAAAAGASDPVVERDPALLGIERPTELNRWLPLVKWFLAIPHYLYAILLGIAVWFALVGAFFAVLFTGRYPRGIFDFVVGVQRWGTRLGAYLFYLRDEYPSFSLGR